MAEQRERKPGTGVAFTNKNKKEDWHADWTGEIKLPDGTLHYLNVSKKVAGHSGQEYIAVSLGKPRTESLKPSNASNVPLAELTDDIPF